eukprot:scaffold317_cov379-Prasinococcus_capsulatus_cf.AAC.6
MGGRTDGRTVGWLVARSAAAAQRWVFSSAARESVRLHAGPPPLPAGAHARARKDLHPPAWPPSRHRTDMEDGGAPVHRWLWRGTPREMQMRL